MRSEGRDLERLGEAFARDLRPRSPECLAWQYRQNPRGEPLAELALAGDRLAAVQAALPVLVRAGGQVRPALQSFDTLTDREHRGRGLFVGLCRALYSRATERGYAFIYGFPNRNSAHGIFRSLGWTSLDPVPFLIRPLRLGRAARRLGIPWLPDLPLVGRRKAPPKGLTLERVERFDGRFDRLWEGFAAGIGVAVERDERYLEWRLAARPQGDYRTLALADRSRDLHAFVSFCTRDKHGGRVGYVLELLHRPGCRREARGLVRHALASMLEEGADVALAWCFRHSPNFAVYLGSGFVPLPERLRPIEMHLGVLAFDGTLRPLVSRRRQWYVSYLDSDTV